MKEKAKQPFATGKVTAIIVISAILLSLPFLYLGINEHQKKHEYCCTRKEYVDVHVRSILLGKTDDGDFQTDAEGRYTIDISSSDRASTVEYKGNTVECFYLTDTKDKSQAVTIGDIRGDFLNDETLRDVPVYTIFPNKEIPVCPFSDSKHTHYYCILGDGTVICSHPECNN